MMFTGVAEMRPRDWWASTAKKGEESPGVGTRSSVVSDPGMSSPSGRASKLPTMPRSRVRRNDGLSCSARCEADEESAEVGDSWKRMSD